MVSGWGGEWVGLILSSFLFPFKWYAGGKEIVMVYLDDSLWDDDG